MTASRWASPERLKSSTVAGVDAVVLAEHEAAQERRLRRPGSRGPERPRRDRGSRRRSPASPPRRRAGEPEPVGDEHLADAVARQVAGLPGLGLAKRAGGLDLAGRSEGPAPARAPRPRAGRRRSGSAPVTSPSRAARDGGHEAARRSPAARPARGRRPASIAARRTAPTASAGGRGRERNAAPARAARAPRPSPRARGDEAEPGGQPEHQRRRERRRPGGRRAGDSASPAVAPPRTAKRQDRGPPICAGDATALTAGAGRAAPPSSPGRCRRSGRARRPRRRRRAGRGSRRCSGRSPGRCPRSCRAPRRSPCRG